MPNKIKLALFSGGSSGEREVSLKTGEQILKALDRDKYEISLYDPRDDILKFVKDAEKGMIDVVFPALHGPYGEDGRLQGMLDMLGVKYVFSGCLASAIAMNKHKTKLLAKYAGLKIIDSWLISKATYDKNNIVQQLGLPLVIKPLELGSSVGMSIAKTKKELEQGVNEAFKFDISLMIEKFVKGRELTATVMEIDGQAIVLPLIEIIPKISGWFDFKAKYEQGGSEEICPARVPEEIGEKVREYAKTIFTELGCKDLARADFIVEEKTGEIFFLEINTIPGMTATSLAPQSAKAYGYEFPQFLDKLIENNFKDQRPKTKDQKYK